MWSGSWVSTHGGALLQTVESSIGCEASDLLGLALRLNPKRAHLLVSRVLGKHIPTDPRVVRGAAAILGHLVSQQLGVAAATPPLPSLGKALDGTSSEQTIASQQLAAFTDAALACAGRPAATPGGRALVIGMAETAVALGHVVADAVPGSVYLHSTRATTSVPPMDGFTEPHSHAPGHLLRPSPRSLLSDGDGPLILVDDELTSGTTLLNVLTVLRRHTARTRCVIATLTDLRDDVAVRRMQRSADELGFDLAVVSLVRAQLLLADSFAETAARLVAENRTDAASSLAPGRWDSVAEVSFLSTPDSGLHGITEPQRRALAGRLHAGVLPAPRRGERVLVLGTEEVMTVPLLLADLWKRADPTASVKFSTTTRSPVAAIDQTGYALRSALEWPGEDGSSRFCYNVHPGQRGAAFDRILVVTNDHPNSSSMAALASALKACAPRVALLALSSFDPGAGP